MLGFYEGYTVGGPAPTTAAAVLNLTGLPGHTANSSFIALILGSGSATCTFLEVDLASCVSFADGPIGYSWRFTDVGTTGVLAATFPFLACVQSCSGEGPDGQGMVSLLDQYCPPGSAVNTFSFASSYESFFTSITMEIREVRDAEAAAVSWNGDGANDHELACGAMPGGHRKPKFTRSPAKSSAKAANHFLVKISG